MKQLFTAFCFAAVLLLTQQDAFAQPLNGMTMRTLWYNYENPNPTWDNWSEIFSYAVPRGVEIGYNRRLDGHTWLVVPVKVGLLNRSANSTQRNRGEVLANLDVLLQENLFKYGSFFSPSLHLGLGTTYNFDKRSGDFNIPAGVGLNFMVAPNFSINVQSQYRFSIENRPGWQHGIGFTAYFGEPAPPDRDKDGVTDAEDKCPDVFGLAALKGCPDRDNDGVADGDDKCPDVAGLESMMGCPDADGDGITDADDACPTEKGLAAFRGCPDTDNDGIADAQDKCPREAGPASNNGCPILDKDGDGILDKDDACPTEKGVASAKGCPDRDGDSVADRDDACPDKAGSTAHKGCPDTDKDGIYDNEDRCPDKPGVAALKGCPEIKKEDKAKLERAIKLVQFESGKATLLKSSNAVLDEVVSVMNQYPEYSLNINGHTDNQGDDKMNMDLSQRRAKTCYDYLVSKGIAASRMAYAGFGETQPVGDNKTAAGRKENRRVVFELYVK
ncbi:MAG: OmpA family protein [Bacteroidetes bacterium]|nr:OmpA family protein [Bacteroidota bacterium]